MSRPSPDAAGGRVGRRVRAARRRLRGVRPSQVVGAAAAVLVALLVGRLVVGGPATVRALAAGGTLGVVVYALASDRPPVRALGAVLLFPAGLLGAVALSVLGAALSAGLATAATVYVTVAAMGAIGFAAALAGAEAPDGGAVERATLRAVAVVLAPLALFVAAVAPDGATAGALLDFVAGVVGDVLGHLLATPASLAVFVFPLLLAATAWALRGALERLPVAELVDPADRDRAAAHLARARRACRYGVAVGGLLLVAALFLAMQARSPDPAQIVRLPLVGAYVPVAASPLLRAPLVLALAASLAVRVGYRLVRWARRATVESLAERVTPVAAGFLATAGLARLFVDAGAVARLVRLADEAIGAGDLLAGPEPFVVAVGALLVAGWLATSWLFALVVLDRLALPHRAAGPALAAAACFALALVAVLVGRLLAGFIAAALAVLAWDAGAYGGALRTEVSGRSGRTELVHVGGSALVAAVAVGAAAMLTVVLGGAIASPSVSSMLALGLAGLSAFLLLSSL